MRALPLDRRAIAGCVVCLLVASCAPMAALRVPAAPVRTGHVVVQRDDGANRELAIGVAGELEWLRGKIGADFSTRPGSLAVQLYRSHRAFSRALWRVQRQRPQSVADDTGSIVGVTLLLGPAPLPYLRHNLAHVYAEWVMDRLSGNRSDRLPAGTWLYDGLAEYEAYRYAPEGMRCTVRGSPPFDVTAVRTPRRWLALRAGGLGSLEYCLAYRAVRRLVRLAGWHSIVAALRRHEPWPRLAARLRSQYHLAAVMSPPAR